MTYSGLKSLRDYSTEYDNILVSFSNQSPNTLPHFKHSYQQFSWRIEISGSMENCSYQSNMESYQPNRDEGLSPDIDSSDSI